MKRWYWIGAILLVSGFLGACRGQSHITMAVTNLEIGDVVNGEIVVREVTVQNDGQADLIIESVTTSCGCTQATVVPMSIPPGSSGILTVEFDSGAHGPDLTGKLIRQVFIITNDPEQPETILELAANILPPVE